MSLKPVMFFASVLAATAMVLPVAPAAAGNYGGHPGGGFHMPSGPSCKPSISIYKPVSIDKDININKNLNINKNVNIYKPININKNIVINKTINANKNININKNINANKNININKNIVINKGGSMSSAEASAMADAFAQAMASANASVTVNNNVNAGSSSGAGAAAAAGALAGAGTYYNSYSEMKIVNKGGQTTPIQTEQHCEMQYASVVKSIHAVCVAANGEEFPASHMIGDTWISASYEGEIARCIPGAYLKVMIGSVEQSDQGMAASYDNGLTLTCSLHEALRHYKNGMLKCAPAVPVPDCTERTNLRRYGTGDMFFTFRRQVCIARSAEVDTSVTGMSLDGGVGD